METDVKSYYWMEKVEFEDFIEYKTTANPFIFSFDSEVKKFYLDGYDVFSIHQSNSKKNWTLSVHPNIYTNIKELDGSLYKNIGPYIVWLTKSDIPLSLHYENENGDFESKGIYLLTLTQIDCELAIKEAILKIRSWGLPGYIFQPEKKISRFKDEELEEEFANLLDNLNDD